MLDWELSTLGDPMADFSYLADALGDPQTAGASGSTGVDLRGAGHSRRWSRRSKRYCAATGRDGVPDLNWYFAYNLFRLAGILQGIAGRVRDGTAASPARRKAPRAWCRWRSRRGNMR